MRAWARHLPLLGLLAGTLVLLGDSLTGQRILFYRDIHFIWYPQIASLVRAVAEGAWPIWDPHPAFGQPALANPGYQLAYPPTWLNLLLLPGTSYALYAAGHALAAGVGLFHLARRLGLGPLPALFGGLCWMASGPFLAFVSLIHHYAGLAWMPWLLVGLDRLLERRSLGAALALGAAMAGQVLAGSGDMCLMTAMLGAGLAAMRLVRRPEPRSAAVFPLLRLAVLAAAFGMALSAVQWLPTAASLRAGSRLGLDPGANMYWSLHPASLADTLVPGLVSDFPMSDPVRALLVESREPFLVSLHLGVGMALLALLALLGGRRLALALTGIFVIFVLFALGRYTPVYALVLKLPPLAVLRYPVKYMAPAGLLVGLLVGLGLETWLRDWPPSLARRARLLAAGFAALALAALGLAEWWRLHPGWLRALAEDTGDLAPTLWRMRLAAALSAIGAALLVLRSLRQCAPVALTAALALLTLGETFVAGRAANLFAPPALARYRPRWTESRRGHRIFSLPLPGAARSSLQGIPPGWSRDWAWTLGVIDVAAPPTGGRWELDGSWDGDFFGLAPPPQSVLSQALLWSWSQPLALRLLQVGGVDDVLSLSDLPWLGTEPERLESLFGEPIRIHRVPGRLPRAYAVSGRRVAAEPASYRLLADPVFDPRREVILPGGTPVPAREGFRGAARLLWRRADALAVEAELSDAGLVVVLDAFDAGWRASVDGVAAPLLRANLLFRAVAVPAGRHTVEMRYRPVSALLGAGLSLAALAVGAAFLLLRVRGRRDGDGPAAVEPPGPAR